MTHDFISTFSGQFGESGGCPAPNFFKNDHWGDFRPIVWDMTNGVLATVTLTRTGEEWILKSDAPTGRVGVYPPKRSTHLSIHHAPTGEAVVGYMRKRIALVFMFDETSCRPCPSWATREERNALVVAFDQRQHTLEGATWK